MTDLFKWTSDNGRWQVVAEATLPVTGYVLENDEIVGNWLQIERGRLDCEVKVPGYVKTAMKRLAILATDKAQQKTTALVME